MALQIELIDKYGVYHSDAYARILRREHLNAVGQEKAVVVDVQVFASREARDSARYPLELTTITIPLDNPDNAAMSDCYRKLKQLHYSEAKDV
jgi:hypothetical protein